MTKTRWGLGIAGALLAGSLLAQATETPLAGSSSRTARSDGTASPSACRSSRWSAGPGVTLAMQRREGKAAASGCKAYLVGVERGTLRLTLGFPTAKPGAKLQSIYVHFEGYQVTAKSAGPGGGAEEQGPRRHLHAADRNPAAHRGRRSGPGVRPARDGLLRRPAGAGRRPLAHPPPSASTDRASELDAVARGVVPPRLRTEEGHVRELGVELVGEVLDRRRSGSARATRAGRGPPLRRARGSVKAGSVSPDRRGRLAGLERDVGAGVVAHVVLRPPPARPAARSARRRSSCRCTGRPRERRPVRCACP